MLIDKLNKGFNSDIFRWLALHNKSEPLRLNKFAPNVTFHLQIYQTFSKGRESPSFLSQPYDSTSCHTTGGSSACVVLKKNIKTGPN